MTLFLVLAALASASPIAFDFVGQPDCVEVRWTGQYTRVVNRCEHPLLVDQSVQLSHGPGVIAPGATVELRDLSAFTMGMDGRLYRVVAVIAKTPEPTAPSEPSGSGTAP